jgi:hypothetical protein
VVASTPFGSLPQFLNLFIYFNYVIKEKMNVTRSILDDVKKKQLQWYGQSKGWRGGDCQKGYWNGDRQGKEKRQTQTYLGGGD